MNYLRSISCAMLAVMTISGCNAQESLALCPNLTAQGKGSRSVEEARRCVRVMAARYSISGEAPSDVATAALGFCRDSKIEPIFSHIEDFMQREKLIEKFEQIFQKNAVQTVVEMRTGNCFKNTRLFDGINDPIDGP